MMADQKSVNRGILLALSAYIFWGFYPVYWRQLIHVPSIEIAAHRVIWTFLFLFILIVSRKGWKSILSKIKASSSKTIIFIPSLLIGSNWFVYVWAVNAGYILETSLGYFISPLFSVFLGVFFLHESLRRLQWIAVSVAGLGVIIMTLIYGQFPWIALYLAGTWSAYGLLRKKSVLNAIEGLTLETAMLSVPVMIYLVYLLVNDSGAFLNIDMSTNLFLIGCGLVTGLPLVVFITAARLINLSLVGFLQYIYPTLLFIIGAYIYGETVSEVKMIGFVFVWIALIIYSLEGILFFRKRRLILESSN